MMSSDQLQSSGVGPPRLHHPFASYDPEAIAVMAMLVGLSQVLLAAPTYHMKADVSFLYLCPLCIGSVFVMAGSFALACERSPTRDRLKGCAYSSIAGLVGALCSVFVYSYVLSIAPVFPPCNNSIMGDPCITDVYVNYFKTIIGLLLFYDVAALILHSFLSLSAVKGLKTQ